MNFPLLEIRTPAILYLHLNTKKRRPSLFRHRIWCQKWRFFIPSKSKYIVLRNSRNHDEVACRGCHLGDDT
jgi:hypothetical protein